MTSQKDSIGIALHFAHSVPLHLRNATSGMAIAETAARKLLHGSGAAAVAGGVGAGTFSFGLDGLWQLPLHLRNATSGMAVAETAARKLLHGSGAAAVARGVGAGTFSFGLDGLWQLISGFFADIFAHLFGALAGAAHVLALPLEAFLGWLQAAAAVALSYLLVVPAALPYVLGVAAVLLLVALLWYCGPVLCAAAAGVCKALVVAVCYLGHGVYFVGAAVARAVSCLLPPCAQCLSCCAVVTMKAPGTAGMLISRAAFVAAPALYFQILRAGGAVVAAAVFCAWPVAWAVAAPVAALFRVSVGA